MAAPMSAQLPPNVDLDLACQIVFEAVDPVTGSAVSSVTVTDALIRVETSITDAGNSLSSGNFVFIAGPSN